MAPPDKSGPRTNEDIIAPKVRLIDQFGETHGIVTREAALERASSAGLDLVEIASEAEPPVVKIVDVGKLKYQKQKQRAEQRRKQKVIDIKEIKLRPTIDIHDYEVKMKSARRFLGEGDKVKVTLRFRGREMAHPELGVKVLDRVRDELDPIAKVEQSPRFEGRQMIMVIAPK